jgi:hypothetical protein
MNDFTKDELNELLMGYEFHEHNTRHNWPSLDLIRKLKYMIDNYCEHDLYETSALVSHCCKCGQCKMVSL